MRTALCLVLLCVAGPAFGAEITQVKNSLALVKGGEHEFKIGDRVEIIDPDGVSIGAAVVSKLGKQPGTYVVQGKPGQLVTGFKIALLGRRARKNGEQAHEENLSPKAEEPSQPLKRVNMAYLGIMKPSGSFVISGALAAGYDFHLPLSRAFNLRAGFWGWFKSEESGSTKLTYTILTLDAGADYFFLNGDFKMGLGARLGYSIPIVTVTFNGTTIPFAGSSAITPSATFSAYYHFSGYVVGAEVRGAFYPRTKMGIPTSIFYLFAFGKEM